MGGPTSRSPGALDGELGEVGLGAPQLGMDSAGGVGLLKNNVTRQIPGLRDHKCIDLGGRHSAECRATASREGTPDL